MSVNAGHRFGNKIGRLFFDFSAKNLTGFGGLIPFAEFMRRVGIEPAFNTLNLGYCPRVYPVGRIVMAFLLGMVSSFDRVREVARLGRDVPLLRALGWNDFPVQSTLSRVLNRFDEERVTRLAEIVAHLLSKFRRGWRDFKVLHMDLDSHVRTVYGSQVEQAVKGYNPNKRGRRSFHPLLAFVGETRDFLLGKLRPGDVHTANGAVEFLEQCFAQIGLERLHKLVLRADSGFCSAPFMQALEAHAGKVLYALAMRLLPTHQRRFDGLDYHCMPGSPPEDGLEIASYMSTDWSDKKARRVVVIRQRVPQGTNAADQIGKQLKLFGLQDYTWRAIVTNSEAPPEAVWRDYNQRACCENYIKEALDFGLDWTASQSFWANAAHLQLVMLSYNLFNWYKEVAFGQTTERNTVRLLRTCIINVPAILKRSSRQLRLCYPRDWPWLAPFEVAIRRVHSWQLPAT